MENIIVKKSESGMKLDRFLSSFFPGAGTGFLYKMMRKKSITLNGKKCTGAERILTGDEIQVFFSKETFDKFRTSEKNVIKNQKLAEYTEAFENLNGIKVVYENDNIIILDKPSGILSQKSKNTDKSLNEWLIGYLLDKNEVTEESLKIFVPSVCNRLDRNTSGLVLCGKSLSGSQYLSKVIADRSVRKFYNAICFGKVDKKADELAYLWKNEKTNKVVLSKAEKPGFSKIETKIVPILFNNQASIIELELVTGKSHQLRAHLAALGHPLFGDVKYGGLEKNKKLIEKYGINDQMLRAVRVEFPDDDIMKGLIVEADPDEQFEKIRNGYFV